MVFNKLIDCQLQKSGNVSISDILQTVQPIAGISSSASYKSDQIFSTLSAKEVDCEFS